MSEITLRTAQMADVPEIMRIMTEAHRAMADPSAYITDDEGYVAGHITENGFTLLAEVDGAAAGFFLVCVPGLEEGNLGYYLGFSERQLRGVAMMDSAAVLPEYQGMGIMGRMFREAVRRTEGQQPYLLGTVAPENYASRRNFEKCGFSAFKIIQKPGGLTRLLMGRFRGGKGPAEAAQKP